MTLINSQSLTLLLLLSPFLISAAALGGNQASPSLGGWQPIKNVTAPEVIETAQFAVAQHNKQADSTLKFRSVVKGEYQVVAGKNYRLIIAAKDGGVDGKYEAVVYVRPWEHYKSLTSFTKV